MLFRSIEAIPMMGFRVFAHFSTLSLSEVCMCARNVQLFCFCFMHKTFKLGSKQNLLNDWTTFAKKKRKLFVLLLNFLFSSVKIDRNTMQNETKGIEPKWNRKTTKLEYFLLDRHCKRIAFWKTYNVDLIMVISAL